MEISQITIFTGQEKYDYLSWRNSEIDKLLKQPDAKTQKKLLKFAYTI